MADAFDYIIVGSGAGGGTLAARRAEAARSVLLLESGGDSRRLAGTNDYQPGINWLPDDYDGLRSVAGGHLASCSCAIGLRESGGVLGSDFRVHGTQGLRVVDVSVFPRIPGFFIASAVYMVGEKAADVILAS
jgi:choline dehydrogenase